MARKCGSQCFGETNCFHVHGVFLRNGGNDLPDYDTILWSVISQHNNLISLQCCACIQSHVCSAACVQDRCQAQAMLTHATCGLVTPLACSISGVHFKHMVDTAAQGKKEMLPSLSTHCILSSWTERTSTQETRQLDTIFPHVRQFQKETLCNL